MDFRVLWLFDYAQCAMLVMCPLVSEVGGPVHCDEGIRSIVHCSCQAGSVKDATLVKVEPGPNQGKAEMCKLEHITVCALSLHL